MSKYSFGELRKTAEAAGGLAATVAAYILADETLRDLFPPQWVALVGGVLTVWRVFKAPNALPAPTADSAEDDVARALTALQHKRDYVTVAEQARDTAIEQVKGLEAVLVSTLNPVASTLGSAVDQVQAAIKRATAT